MSRAGGTSFEEYYQGQQEFSVEGFMLLPAGKVSESEKILYYESERHTVLNFQVKEIHSWRVETDENALEIERKI
jgi:hypothetical protein